MTWSVEVVYDADDTWAEKSQMLIDAVGSDKLDGSGVGFGQRDMDWYVDTEEEANEMVAKLTAVGKDWPGFSCDADEVDY